MSQTDDEENSEIESFVIDPGAFENYNSALASKLALLAAGCSSSGDSSVDPVDAETQARLEALLEAAGIRKLSTPDGKAFADPEVLRRLSSSVSCALDEAAAALSKMKTDNLNESYTERSLMKAYNEGDLNTVRKLLMEGRSANETEENGDSLLSLACSAGYIELAEVLLTMNADVDECRNGETTPLMEAASGGHADIVELLLAHGADVNAITSIGYTPLTFACCGGHEKVVKILVEHGADLECENENGHTPLMQAASNGHVGVASILLQHGAGIYMHSSEFKESALTLACYKGHLSMVEFLLKAGQDWRQKTDELHTALMEASMDGHVEVARSLLDAGAQVNMPAENLESPLSLAACGGHVNLAKLLIERGAALEDINDEGYTPLMESCREGHDEMTSLLIAKGAQVDAETKGDYHETALTLACCGGYIACANILVKAGANIESGSATPLMEAARGGQLELVRLLIEQGANVNAISAHGDPPLSLACEHGYTDVADRLVSQGAELEPDTIQTPLMKAARAGHLCTVQFLITRGADVNRMAKDKEHSALSLACVCGHLPIVELLLCQGADPTIKLKDNSNALLEACKSGHTAIVQVLLDYPHSFVTVPTECNQAIPSSPEQLAPRVPTLAPPPVPDDSRQLPLPPSSSQYPTNLNPLTSCDVGKDSSDSGKGLLPTLHQQQFQHSDHTSVASSLSFNDFSAMTPAAFAADHLSSELSTILAKHPGDAIESLLTETATANKARSAESIVEEAQGKLTELEQRIREAIEKNTHFKKMETTQGDQFPKGKVEELYKTRQEQVHKKQKILEELQKVERELHQKTQQHIEKRCRDIKADCATPHTGTAVGVEPTKVVGQFPRDFDAALSFEPEDNEEFTLSPTTRVPANTPTSEDHTTSSLPLSSNLNNGTSGSISQPAKGQDRPFSQTLQHPPCMLHQHSQSGGFVPPSPVLPQPQLDVNSQLDTTNDSPLSLAAAGGHDNLVAFLISRGANIELRDKKGCTPLIVAANAGYSSVVSILLEANADVEATSERTKDTALSLACSSGKLEMVELLLRRAANKEHRNVSDYTPLSLAASGGYTNIIKLLLSHGAEINSRTGSKLGISPLMLAAMNGHIHAVQLLLNTGADINAQIETNRNTALTLACFQGRHEVVSLLVDRRANVEHRAKTGLTPLMEAASGGYAEVGEILLNKGADPNAPPVPSSRDTALTIAADKGHYKFCELIIARGAVVNVANKKGNSPLWLACSSGHLEVVILLVTQGADLNFPDGRNITPLMAAFRKGHVQVVRWLAKKVKQFPSDNECMRYIATLSDSEQLKRTQQCMESIVRAKELLEKEANKFASKLLEELDLEKSQQEGKKERAARKRQKRKLKKKQKTMKKELDDTKDEKSDNETKDDAVIEDINTAIKDVISSTNKLQIDDTPVTTVAKATARSLHTAAVTLTSSTEGNVLLPATSTESPLPAVASEVPSEESTTLAKGKDTDADAISPIPVQPQEKQTPDQVLMTSPSPAVDNIISTEARLSPRSGSLRKLRKPLSSNRSTTTTTAASSNPRCSSNPNYTITTLTPKRSHRRDDGWKEVSNRKYGTASGGKRIVVAANLISRVIGRGGNNINAIRDITEAHIDIDKLKKGGQERTITIKGSMDAVEHAQELITSLITEDKTDTEITDIIAKAQAEAAQVRSTVTRQLPPKTAAKSVVAAPIPSKPAWTIPPSIVASSSRQNQPQVTSPTVSVGVWVPSTVEKTSTNDASTITPTSWVQSVMSTSSNSSIAEPTVESVKKALFQSSSATDKAVSKPVQPVAPMVLSKIALTSAAATRIPHSSYGPVGSALPSQRSVMPVPIPSDQNSLSSVHRIVELAQNPVAPNHGLHHSTIPNLSESHLVTSTPGQMTHNWISSSGQNLRNQQQNAHFNQPGTDVPIGILQGHNPDMTRHNLSGTPGFSVSDTGAAALLQSDHNNDVNPILNMQGVFCNGPTDDKGFSFVPTDTNIPATRTYSPFRNSYTPTAGSTAFWDEEAPGYHLEPTSLLVANKLEPDRQRSTVDQSKAPGYRGNVNSPAMDAGASTASAPGNPTNPVENSPLSIASQSSPSAAESEVVSKPQPIGTERANQRRGNIAQLHGDGSRHVAATVVQETTSVWSYATVNSARFAKDPPDPRMYTTWSTSILPMQNAAIMTSATSSKPHVTVPEISSSFNVPVVPSQLSSPPMRVVNPQLRSQAPRVNFPLQNRTAPVNSHFSRPSVTGGVSSQLPIGSHLEQNSGVGLMGPHPQQSVLPPIGSHLSGAGHMRGNSFQHGQLQRNLPATTAIQQQPPRYSMPYYVQQHQTNVHRHVSDVGSDVNWQPQHQQHSMYNYHSRHPSLPYHAENVQDVHSDGRMYGGMPAYSDLSARNMQQHDVLHPQPNKPAPYNSVRVNMSFPVAQAQHNQANFVGDLPYYDGMSDYVAKSMIPSDYGNPAPDMSGNWNHSMCGGASAYQSISGGPGPTHMVCSTHQWPAEDQQGWYNW